MTAAQRVGRPGRAAAQVRREALGLLLDWVFASLIIGLVLGVAAALGSVLLARGASGTAAAVLFGLVAGVPALFSGRAWADDGGWHECSCSDDGFAGVIAWFGSEGAGTVVANGALGGVFAGVGTAIGVGMGSVAASLAVAAAAQTAASAAGSGAREGAGSTPTQREPTQDPPAASDQTPTVPQQPPAPPVEDFLPEPPDRKKDKREGEGGQSQ